MGVGAGVGLQGEEWSAEDVVKLMRERRLWLQQEQAVVVVGVDR